MRSSDSDRALASAQALLRGLFAPLRSGDDGHLDYQFVPVHGSPPSGKDMVSAGGGEIFFKLLCEFGFLTSFLILFFII